MDDCTNTSIDLLTYRAMMTADAAALFNAKLKAELKEEADAELERIKAMLDPKGKIDDEDWERYRAAKAANEEVRKKLKAAELQALKDQLDLKDPDGAAAFAGVADDVMAQLRAQVEQLKKDLETAKTREKILQDANDALRAKNRRFELEANSDGW